MQLEQIQPNTTPIINSQNNRSPSRAITPITLTIPVPKMQLNNPDLTGKQHNGILINRHERMVGAVKFVGGLLLVLTVEFKVEGEWFCSGGS